MTAVWIGLVLSALGAFILSLAHMSFAVFSRISLSGFLEEKEAPDRQDVLKRLGNPGQHHSSTVDNPVEVEGHEADGADRRPHHTRPRRCIARPRPVNSKSMAA